MAAVGGLGFGGVLQVRCQGTSGYARGTQEGRYGVLPHHQVGPFTFYEFQTLSCAFVFSGDPTTYNPGQIYTVSLKGDKTQFEQKQFSEFLLVVENAEEHNIQDGRKTGTFQV